MNLPLGHLLFFLSCIILTYTSPLSVSLTNYCNETLCPALTGVDPESGMVMPIQSPSCLKSLQTQILSINPPWAGRIWARAGCHNGTRCQIGDCGRENCNGLSSQNTTLIEFTLQKNNLLWYDISLGRSLHHVVVRCSY